MSEPTAIDFFSGVGGFSLGFEQAGFNVMLAIDDHEVTLNTYKKNFPDTTVKQLDLSAADTEEILVGTDINESDVDVLFGGPPCQGFSVMGNQDPNDERNVLLERFGRYIIDIQPKYFVVENVEGLLSDAGEQHLSKFIELVESGGYGVVRPLQVLNAADFGVPQDRNRVIILGSKNGLPEPGYPEPSGDENSVSDALNDIPDDLSSVNIEDGVYAGPLDEQSDYVKRLNKWRGMDTEGLSGMDPVSHTESVRERFQTVEPGGCDDVSQFKRLHLSGKSNTLRAGSGRDRGTHTPARPIHPSSPRCITVREAARLQSFPDWFEFHPTKYHGLRQIGNSVPPLLAKHIAEELINTLSD